ncbi:MAG: hypothetical protein AAGK93_01830, partial [Pseudomonadota bacterium]
MRVSIRLAVLVTVGTAIAVYMTREPTGDTATAHAIYSLTFAGPHFILMGIYFTVMRLFRGGSIRDRFAAAGPGMLIASVLLAVVAL